MQIRKKFEVKVIKQIGFISCTELEIILKLQYQFNIVKMYLKDITKFCHGKHI